VRKRPHLYDHDSGTCCGSEFVNENGESENDLLLLPLLLLLLLLLLLRVYYDGGMPNDDEESATWYDFSNVFASASKTKKILFCQTMLIICEEKSAHLCTISPILRLPMVASTPARSTHYANEKQKKKSEPSHNARQQQKMTYKRLPSYPCRARGLYPYPFSRGHSPYHGLCHGLYPGPSPSLYPYQNPYPYLCHGLYLQLQN
jgi:hypothetical protein